MLWFLSILLYNFQKFDKAASRVIAYPIHLITRPIIRTKSFKKFYRSRGGDDFERDTEKGMKKVMDHPVYGMHALFASAHMYCLIVALVFSINVLMSAFLKKFFDTKQPDFVYFIVLGCLIIPYELFFEWNDRYLKYFKQFKKLSPQAKRRSAWMTFGVVVFVWGFTIWSVLFGTYLRHGTMFPPTQCVRPHIRKRESRYQRRYRLLKELFWPNKKETEQPAESERIEHRAAQPLNEHPLLITLVDNQVTFKANPETPGKIKFKFSLCFKNQTDPPIDLNKLACKFIFHFKYGGSIATSSSHLTPRRFVVRKGTDLVVPMKYFLNIRKSYFRGSDDEIVSLLTDHFISLALKVTNQEGHVLGVSQGFNEE